MINPFTRGAYSNNPVGILLEDRTPLLRPVADKLVFAGEAVTVNGNYATVHGAIESGRWAAENIVTL